MSLVKDLLKGVGIGLTEADEKAKLKAEEKRKRKLAKAIDKVTHDHAKLLERLKD